MKHLAFALGSSLLVACAVDEVPAPPELTPIAFSVEGSYALSTTSSGSVDMGPTSGRSCFLTGIGGYLKADFSIRIREVNGEYELDASTDLWLKVTARCVDGGHTAEVSQLTPGSTPIAAMQSGRRCFLTGLQSHDPNNALILYDFTSDGFDITNDGSTWSLGGQMKSFEAQAIGYARCFDGTEDLGGEGITTGDSSVTIGLTNEPGAACGLQTVKGVMHAEPTDEGIFIPRDPTTKQYSLTVDADRTGVAGCIK